MWTRARATETKDGGDTFFSGSIASQPGVPLCLLQAHSADVHVMCARFVYVHNTLSRSVSIFIPEIIQYSGGVGIHVIGESNEVISTRLSHSLTLETQVAPERPAGRPVVPLTASNYKLFYTDWLEHWMQPPVHFLLHLYIYVRSICTRKSYSHKSDWGVLSLTQSFIGLCVFRKVLGAFN